ncbi:MAG: cobalamin biosynthesis protein [Campylobacterales bacterium]|nr:cobalamin biosynthesis protein [Campylobacterales bacterium]
MYAKENDFEISNIEKLANISNSLINKKTVSVVTYKKIFEDLKSENLEFIDLENEVEISNPKVYIVPGKKSDELLLKPPVYLGIGMNRGTTLIEIEEAVNEFLDLHGLDLKNIKAIGSFEAKSDEVGLLEYLEKYGFEENFFSEKDINNLEEEFSRSKAEEFFQIKGVAEPSAYLLSKYKILFAKKEVFNKKITIGGAI